MNGMPTMGLLMWLFMILFWGLAIFGLVIAVRWAVNRGKGGQQRERPQTPLEALKLRYARGEIDREEFERVKKELE